MSSTGLAESARAGKATHEAISVVSPGEEDEEKKDQDRVRMMEVPEGDNAKCQLAIVCDGTTTSPCSAAAATEVADQLQSLFQEGGLLGTTRILQELRLALLEKPLQLEEGLSAMLRSMFEEIVKQKYQNSYQTTLVAVCLKFAETDPPGTLRIKALGCGDSALFIFRENGELLYNNINLADALDGFKHSSPLTAVLPDSYDEETKNVLFDFEAYPEDVHILLCSDGLYDAFTNFNEVAGWLHEHYSDLKNSGRDASCLSELHAKLARTKGDDDISFIWLRPPKRANEDPAAETEKEKDAVRENVVDGKQSFLAKLLAVIRCWFRRKSGGSPSRGLNRLAKKQDFKSLD